MFRRLPPLLSLRAFEAAARLGGMTAAAAELGVTHGAVSRQVRLLEEWLGRGPLLHRTPRGLVPTGAGEALRDELGDAFRRIRRAVGRAAGEGAGPKVVLRVDTLPSIAALWLLPRLPRFRAARPEVELRLSTSNTSVDGLRGSCDVAIRGGPDTLDGFVTHEFLREQRLPVCAPSIAEGLRGPDDLRRQVLIHLSTLPGAWPDWLALAGVPEFEPAGAMELDHFFLTGIAARAGLGVAIGPLALFAEELKSGALVAPFGLDGPALRARSYCAYLRMGLRGASADAAAAFVSWMEAEGAVA